MVLGSAVLNRIFWGMIAACMMAMPHAHAQDVDASMNSSKIPYDDLRTYATFLRKALDDEGSNGLEAKIKACYRQAQKKTDLLPECIVVDKAAKILEDAYLREMAKRFNTTPIHDNIWRDDRFKKRIAESSAKAFGSEQAAEDYLGNGAEIIFFLAMSTEH